MARKHGETQGQKDHRELIEGFARRREDLLQAGKLSVPSEAGKLVIVVSAAAGSRNKKSEETLQSEYETFLEEAERIKGRRDTAARYAEILIRDRAVIAEMQADFADPEVSDIMLIGHGSIARFWTEKSGGMRDFSWMSAAEATTHLKQGKVEQQMCGHFPRLGYSIPLGTFAVSQLSNVTAAVGNIISIPDGSPRDHLFGPVYDDTTDVLEQIDALNEMHQGNAGTAGYASPEAGRRAVME